MTIQNKKNPSLTPLNLCAYVTTHLSGKGIALEAMLSGSGLKPQDFDTTARLLNLSQEQQVLLNALSLSSNTSLGLEIGLAARISAYGLLGYAMMTAPTLRVGLGVSLRLPALLGTYFQLKLTEEEHITQLSLEGCRAPLLLEPALTELCLGSFKTLISDMLGSAFIPRSAQFRYQADDGMADAYTEGFECPISFSHPKSMIVFDSALLDQKLPLADRLCHQKVLELCLAQNRELVANREWLEKLRCVLSENLLTPPTLETLGGLMHCSPRTLRRQLQMQNSSYRQLLDELRFEKAKALLIAGAGTSDQIAEQLGFSDGASFRRAFRRWCGMSPNSFRP